MLQSKYDSKITLTGTSKGFLENLTACTSQTSSWEKIKILGYRWKQRGQEDGRPGHV